MIVTISKELFDIFPEFQVYGILFQDIKRELISAIDFAEIRDIEQEKVAAEIQLWNRDIYKIQ